jgi:hypothetical protein
MAVKYKAEIVDLKNIWHNLLKNKDAEKAKLDTDIVKYNNNNQKLKRKYHKAFSALTFTAAYERNRSVVLKKRLSGRLDNVMYTLTYGENEKMGTRVCAIDGKPLSSSEPTIVSKCDTNCDVFHRANNAKDMMKAFYSDNTVKCLGCERGTVVSMTCTTVAIKETEIAWKLVRDFVPFSTNAEMNVRRDIVMKERFENERATHAAPFIEKLQGIQHIMNSDTASHPSSDIEDVVV